MKLTLRDRFVLLFLILGLASFFAVKLIIKPLGIRIEDLRTEKVETLGLKTDISPLIEQSKKLKTQDDTLKENVDNIRNANGGKTLTVEEFLVFLGNSTKRNDVSVLDFSDVEQKQTDGLYRSVFDFEIRGKSKDIGKVLDEIESMGIKCSYGSLSYRQNAEYDYLMRFFDLFTELPWYKEKEDEDNQATEEAVLEDVQENLIRPDISIPELPLEEGNDTANEQEILPENKNEDINERLNRLLEQISYSTKESGMTLIAKKTANNSQDMRLAVTVCFIMFTEPSEGHSILSVSGV